MFEVLYDCLLCWRSKVQYLLARLVLADAQVRNIEIIFAHVIIPAKVSFFNVALRAPWHRKLWNVEKHHKDDIKYKGLQSNLCLKSELEHVELQSSEIK